MAFWNSTNTDTTKRLMNNTSKTRNEKKGVSNGHLCVECGDSIKFTHKSIDDAIRLYKR